MSYTEENILVAGQQPQQIFQKHFIFHRLAQWAKVLKMLLPFIGKQRWAVCVLIPLHNLQNVF